MIHHPLPSVYSGPRLPGFVPCLTAALVLASALTGAAAPRTWTEAGSGRTLQGEYLRMQGEDVLIRRANGTTVTVPLERLSQADRDFIAGPRGSGKPGTVLIREDFSSGTPDKTKFNNEEWNVAENWELRDGAIACIYDPKLHPGQAHGKSIDPQFKARDVRVSYRVRFDSEDARLSVVINAGFPPVKTGVPIWHIGDVDAHLPRKETNDCVFISERDFTYDVNDPRNTMKSHGPADIFKPLNAYEVPGINCKGHAPLVQGQWHRFAVESAGTKWTLWIDGKETLTLTLQHSDCEKESVNFIAFAPLLLDDIVIEELTR
ncbi:MAG: hypothetical protein DVB23_002298 [Verrucomicrobia bacterium]|jgi:hypothetical protein|nr:MAG: hypothetical protein DVB23_002298 [Verrucomicrobiota bacterium]